jgi:FlaA1/EpsC-like NDP-sugar epimerase
LAKNNNAPLIEIPIKPVIKKVKSFFNMMLSHSKTFDRRAVALAHDLLVALIVITLSLWIRVGEDFSLYPGVFILKHTAVYTLLSAGVFLWLQLYRGVWRYVSMNEVIAISLATACITLLYLPLMFLMGGEFTMPRSIVIISWFVMTGLLCFSRIVYRSFHDRWEKEAEASFSSVPQSRVLLIGSTNQAEMFIRDMQRNPKALYEIVGIVDQTTTRVGRQIHGVEIMGVLEDLPNIITQLNFEGRHPHHIVIADPEFKEQAYIHKLLRINSNFKVDLAKLPNMENFTKPGPHGIEIKPIQIEDLLGRKQINLNREAMSRFIKGRRVLITGAGGTIGGELVRQVASFDPKSVILLDHSEYLLYSIDLEIKELFPDVYRSMVLADVTDEPLIDDIIREEKPDIVFHAAALKHVPIAEFNPCQTILTNVIGTRNVAEACRKHGVKAMIMISTDKAVFPSSIMGATKRLAESLCQAIDAQNTKKKTTRFITTRFGNVLGSTGSVVPLFKRQLAQGGPITVTHPEIKRYFMTVQEAVELVLEAAVVGINTPQTAGQIFVLDMGQPIRILDLAEQMIQLAGLKPYDDIKIEFSGLRPGEKLIEELFLASEKLIQTSCDGLMLAAPALSDYKILMAGVDALEELARTRKITKAIEKLRELVPEYTPTPNGEGCAVSLKQPQI